LGIALRGWWNWLPFGIGSNSPVIYRKDHKGQAPGILKKLKAMDKRGGFEALEKFGNGQKRLKQCLPTFHLGMDNDKYVETIKAFFNDADKDGNRKLVIKEFKELVNQVTKAKVGSVWEEVIWKQALRLLSHWTVGKHWKTVRDRNIISYTTSKEGVIHVSDKDVEGLFEKFDKDVEKYKKDGRALFDEDVRALFDEDVEALLKQYKEDVQNKKDVEAWPDKVDEDAWKWLNNSKNWTVSSPSKLFFAGVSLDFGGKQKKGAEMVDTSVVERILIDKVERIINDVFANVKERHSKAYRKARLTQYRLP